MRVVIGHARRKLRAPATSFSLLRGIRVGCLAGNTHGIEPDLTARFGNNETPTLENGSLTKIPFMISTVDKGLHQTGNGLRIYTISD
jgi:hypothetical protein